MNNDTDDDMDDFEDMGDEVEIRAEFLGTLSEQELDALEQRLGFALPEDYRAFLAATNGGTLQGIPLHSEDFPEEMYEDEEYGEERYTDIFFGVGLKERSLNLEFWRKEKELDLPPSCLIVGCDIANCYIVYQSAEDGRGWYYADDSGTIPGADDADDEEMKLYWLGESFSELIDPELWMPEA